jgi:hypothetical protein
LEIKVSFKADKFFGRTEVRRERLGIPSRLLRTSSQDLVRGVSESFSYVRIHSALQSYHLNSKSSVPRLWFFLSLSTSLPTFTFCANTSLHNSCAHQSPIQ